ncbi:hypothetical protein [Rubellimicrobium aerolatum]|uniref:Uncharacterized protein n=1 Tax=Rubellimicrobium aerolatum TaxID=490979 RepID=A0ABW0S8I5_9RHOB|nr:hypothetical protein [Rubellimicrobium aerolatum]MBP1804214.1 hypothetical protein [Rubellimicrobium aerolatum]
MGVLRLEAVGDPDREESSCFALLDPHSPEVHDLCRLTDALERLLADIDAAIARARDGQAAPGDESSLGLAS